MNTYDPKAWGARCDECVLKGSIVVPPNLVTGAEAILVGESPSVQEIKKLSPFLGRSGMMLEAALAAAGKPRSSLSLTNTTLCRPENNDLRAAVRRVKAHNDRVKATNKERRTENRQRKRRGDPPLPMEPLKPTPQDCCRPRLLRELGMHRNVIALGKTPNVTLTGDRSGIITVRGSMEEVGLDMPDGGKQFFRYLATLHPSMVNAQPRWKGPFVHDVQKAFRFFEGRLQWSDPAVVYHPRAKQLEQLLLGDGLEVDVKQRDGTTRPKRLQLPRFGDGTRWCAYDFETQHKLSSLDAMVRCIGIGGTDWAVLVGVLPILATRALTWARRHGSMPPWWPGAAAKAGLSPEWPPVYGHPWYSRDEYAYVQEVLDRWAQDASIIKAGWNSGYYDRLVYEQWRGITPARPYDGILGWRLVAGELPKGLGTAGTWMTDAPNWKGDHTATRTDRDRDLHAYCAQDVAITAQVVAGTLPTVEARGQSQLLPIDHATQDMCVGAHRNGLWVDPGRQQRFEAWLHEEKEWTGLRCEQLSGLPGHNPRSFPQVGRLLYDRWDLTPPHYSADTGEPSTDDAALRILLRDKRLEGHQRGYIQTLRRHRKCTKRLSTYLFPMRPETTYWRGSSGEQHGRVARSDERLHPGYLAHTAITGRISSASINAQNIEKVFRLIFRPQEPEALVRLWEQGSLHHHWGHLLPAPGSPAPAWTTWDRCFVGADMDQLELRVSAALSNCDSYLQAFREGKDPHAITARLLFGQRFERELKHKDRTGKKTAEFSSMRDFAKTFVYLVTYGGSAETAWNNLTAFEDRSGKLVYAHMKLAAVEALRRKWLKGAPEYERWWSSCILDFKQQGHLADKVDGRRRDFLDGEDFNELVNFGVQAAGNQIVQQATRQFLSVYSHRACWNAWGPGTGLVTQTHDANMIEAPYGPGGSVAAKLREDLEEAMTLRIPGLDVPFTAEARIVGKHPAWNTVQGDSWKEAC